jgi:hypothetical protein
VIANPLINITLQGRHDTYPKRRGMTRVPELMAAGVNVAFGHDCVMDPWYGMGSGDMLEVAHMGLHVAQMTSQKGIRACYDAVTVNAGEGDAPAGVRPGRGVRRELCAAAGAGCGGGDPVAGEPVEGVAVTTKQTCPPPPARMASAVALAQTRLAAKSRGAPRKR